MHLKYFIVQTWNCQVGVCSHHSWRRKNTFNLVVLAFLLVMIISWGPFILFSVCDFSLTEKIDYSWTKEQFFSIRFRFTLKENCFCSVCTKDLMMFEVKQNDLVENISVRTTRLVIKDVIVNFQNMTWTLIQISSKNVLSYSQISNSGFLLVRYLQKKCIHLVKLLSKM